MSGGTDTSTGTAFIGTAVVFVGAYLIEKTRGIDWLRPFVQLLALLPQCLKPGALVYCERGEALEAGPGWEIFKAGRAGQVSHQLLKRAEHE